MQICVALLAVAAAAEVLAQTGAHGPLPTGFPPLGVFNGTDIPGLNATQSGDANGTTSGIGGGALNATLPTPENGTVATLTAPTVVATHIRTAPSTPAIIPHYSFSSCANSCTDKFSAGDSFLHICTNTTLQGTVISCIAQGQGSQCSADLSQMTALYQNQTACLAALNAPLLPPPAIPATLTAPTAVASKSFLSASFTTDAPSAFWHHRTHFPPPIPALIPNYIYSSCANSCIEKVTDSIGADTYIHDICTNTTLQATVTSCIAQGQSSQCSADLSQTTALYQNQTACLARLNAPLMPAPAIPSPSGPTLSAPSAIATFNPNYSPSTCAQTCIKNAVASAGSASVLTGICTNTTLQGSISSCLAQRSECSNDLSQITALFHDQAACSGGLAAEFKVPSGAARVSVAVLAAAIPLIGALALF
ncbi:hypothetical protein BDK51DRAFT_39696 [Blyttiomyces helicus]|uniref:Extracellular membrane protein CFEM domain-containing protein n=1 Tax=Blyttiomyces helicus TaxID=388810 RepID=A0A4P9W828_9FUNG|nr:hypothetical protein BDK51DRAFT_39696 [Blyttiomyces helicus]|eukprot:RKO88661.1 hypothetical protein BDK51DRAFT_39696 [Blyttiomyces helicus]